MNAERISELEKIAAAKVERYLPQLEDRYARAFRAAGRRAASAFEAKAVPHIVAAGDDKEQAAWTPPDFDEILDQELVKGDWQTKAAGIHKSMIRASVGSIISDVGIRFNLKNPLVQALLESMRVRTGSAINEAAQDELRAVVGKAWSEGLSIPHTAAMIRDRIEGASKAWSTTWARTDMLGLVNGGSLIGASMVGATEKTWITAGDDKVRDSHAEAEGQTVAIDQPFQVGGAALQFPGDPDGPDEEVYQCRCCGPDVPVSVIGAFSAGYVRPFEGEMVGVTTASGHYFSVTPNHPVLTRHGWISAGDLKEGDDLICRSGLDGSLTSPDVDDVPAKAHQVFTSLAVVATRHERVMGAVVDFHGDIPDCQVEVVALDDVLSGTDDSTILEKLRQLALALTHREMGLDSDPTALNGVLETKEISGGRPASAHSGVVEDHPDGSPRNVVSAAERKNTLSSDVVSDDTGGDVAIASMEPGRSSGGAGTSNSDFLETTPNGHHADALLVRDLLITETGLVEIDPVVDVVVFPYKGHVYNFSSTSGTFLADGVIVANCTQTYVVPGEGEVEASGEDLVAAGTSGQTAALPSGGDMKTEETTGLAAEAPEVDGVEALRAAADKLKENSLGPLIADRFTLTAAAGEQTKWRAVLLTEEEPTEDGRMIAEGATTWRTLPLSLTILKDGPHADLITEAPVCGRIDTISRDGLRIVASGVFDDLIGDAGSDPGREAARLVAEKMLNGISVDMAVLAYEVRVNGETITEDENMPDIVEGEEEILFVITEGVIGSAAICPFQAIAEAEINSVVASANEQKPMQFTRQFAVSVASAAPPEQAPVPPLRIELVGAEAVQPLLDQIAEVAESLAALNVKLVGRFAELDEAIEKRFETFQARIESMETLTVNATDKVLRLEGRLDTTEQTLVASARPPKRLIVQRDKAGRAISYEEQE